MGNSKLNRVMKPYLWWFLIVTIILIIMDIFVFIAKNNAGLIVLGFIILHVAVSAIYFLASRTKVYHDMVRFAANYGQVQKRLIKELMIPYSVLDEEGRLIWANDEFYNLIEHERAVKGSISNVFASISKESFPRGVEDVSLHIQFKDRSYNVVLKRIVTPDFEDGGEWLAEAEVETNGGNVLIAMYLYDESDIVRLRHENEEQRMVCGLLYIDNYEEALVSIDEVRSSLLMALVDRKVNKYMQGIDAIVRKLEKDKYIFIFKNKYLLQLQESKFAILDDVRTISIGNDMSVTISMGIGVHDTSYDRVMEYARAAIDLALSRGGDQVVVKEGEKLLYYGGKSATVEKSTRVKARVKAHALKEYIEANDKVMVMGHSIIDIDSFGAAVGIYRIAKTLDKKAHIVVDNVTSTVRPMLTKFVNNPDYDEDLIVDNQAAIKLVDSSTLLVVVDVNRPRMTECEELLQYAQSVVILDHHRQTGDVIEKASLSYIEPYASSTCEMIAEIMQYIGEGLKLRQIEADAMYAGMMIDTNNFLTKTGVRTFEAAAFLKRNGADLTKVRKMFRSDMEEYLRMASSAASAEVYGGQYVFAVCDGSGMDTPTVLAAQVANELLDIDGIKGTFVFTEYNGKIYISARSIDELNVQVVMEKLGGGGHMSAAGAQLEGTTVEEAKTRVKEVLEEMAG